MYVENEMTTCFRKQIIKSMLRKNPEHRPTVSASDPVFSFLVLNTTIHTDPRAF